MSDEINNVEETNNEIENNEENVVDTVGELLSVNHLLPAEEVKW